MKKTKIFISIFMALAILTASMVPAFAMTDEELRAERSALKSYADNCEFVYIYYYQEAPLSVPGWSLASTQRMKDAIEKARAEADTYTTEEEFEAAYALFNEAEEKMYVDPRNLEWMIDYLAKDYNSTGYYDEETYANIKNIYEQAKADLQSEDELKIHNAYIDMRNLLDDLCLYNPVPGDVDKSGKLDIRDIALMQLELAKLNQEEFTSSQNFVASFTHLSTISDVANWQLALAKLNDYEALFNSQQKKIDTLSAFEGLEPGTKDFSGTTERANYMFYDDCYIWWI